MKKNLIIIILLLVVGGRVLAQHEFEYVFDSIKNESPCSTFYDIIELDNGDFIIHGKDKAFEYDYYDYNLYRFSPAGELITEKQFHDELSLPGYDHSDPQGLPLLTDPDGGFYMFLLYNPVFDTTSANYISGTFDAKIILKKLNDEFEEVYSREISVSLDTTDWENLWGQSAAGRNAPHVRIGTVLDDNGDGFVISYEKYIGEYAGHLWNHGRDTTVFIKTDHELNIRHENRYAHEKCIDLVHRNHLLYDSELDKYFFYVIHPCGNAGYGFNVLHFDSDFNFIEEHNMPGTDGSGSLVVIMYSDGITMKRTSSHTTIFGAKAWFNDILHKEDIRFVSCVEVNDNARRVDSIRFAYTYPKNGSYGFGTTITPIGGCMDWVDENRIFVGGQPYAYVYYSLWLVEDYNKNFILRRLDRDFNTLDELYYNLGVDSTSLVIDALKATRDGGCIIAGYFRNYVENPGVNVPRAFHSIVKKFPPEAFDGIEEAHDSGLKLACAYPNPGNNRLNIRTALSDSHIYVYDINGNLVYNHNVTDLITPIDTNNWPSGLYLWEVVSKGEVTESGTWIKE